MILKKLVVGPFASNCYIVGSEKTKQGLVIDPGDEGKQISKAVDTLGLDIKIIVLTHGHIDHISALKEVKEATGAAVAVHADDAKAIQQRSPMSVFITHSLSSPPSPDRLIKDGDSIDIGDLHFLVIHTPGHSPGSICLYGQGVLFSGDTLFNYGIGRTDMPGGSHNQLMNAIKTKLMVLPDETIVCPGHGPDSTIAAERRGNPFLRM